MRAVLDKEAEAFGEALQAEVHQRIRFSGTPGNPRTPQQASMEFVYPLIVEIARLRADVDRLIAGRPALHGFVIDWPEDIPKPSTTDRTYAAGAQLAVDQRAALQALIGRSMFAGEVVDAKPLDIEMRKVSVSVLYRPDKVQPK